MKDNKRAHRLERKRLEKIRKDTIRKFKSNRNPKPYKREKFNAIEA